MLGARIFKPTTVILVTEDPAVDLEKSSLREYLEAWDEKHLVFHEGKQPSRFTIKQLTEAQKDYLDAIQLPRQKGKTAIRFALQAIENYQVQNENGEIVTPDLGERKPFGDNLGTALTSSAIDSLMLSTQVLVTLHAFIMKFSEAQPRPLA